MPWGDVARREACPAVGACGTAKQHADEKARRNLNLWRGRSAAPMSMVAEDAIGWQSVASTCLAEPPPLAFGRFAVRF